MFSHPTDAETKLYWIQHNESEKCLNPHCCFRQRVSEDTLLIQCKCGGSTTIPFVSHLKDQKGSDKILWSPKLLLNINFRPRSLNTVKYLWRQFARSFCRWALNKWFPWQYDVGAKLDESERVVRLWELDPVVRQKYSVEFKRTWNQQVSREKFLGKTFVGWLRKSGDLYFYPKV